MVPLYPPLLPVGLLPRARRVLGAPASALLRVVLQVPLGGRAGARPDSVEHFLLDCVYKGVGMRRQKLWKDIGALRADSELASAVAVVTGILSQVAAPRDVVIPDAQRLVLLRLLLDGDLKDAMPEGYTSVHETPLCGPALAHTRMRELADGFLCDAARLREAFFRHWALEERSGRQLVTTTHSSPTPRESRVLL